MEEDKEIKNVKIVYAALPPFVEISGEEGNEILGGFMPAMFEKIAQWMDLNVTWIREPEDKYGTLQDNTWTGMCGMLYRNEVDMILNPLLPVFEFFEFGYYTNPITYEAFTFLSGQEKQDGGLFLYFSVLEPSVWLCLGVALLVISLTSALLYRNIFDKKWNRWIRSLCQYLWVYVAYMLRQRLNRKSANQQIRESMLTLDQSLSVFSIRGLREPWFNYKKNGMERTLVQKYHEASSVLPGIFVCCILDFTDPHNKWMLRKNKSLLSFLVLLLISVWTIGVSFLVMTVFQSLLVSKLTIIKSLPVVDSLQDFVSNTRVQGAIPVEIELQLVLKGSGIPLYENAWKKMEKTVYPSYVVFSEPSYQKVEKGETCIAHGHVYLKSVLSDYFKKHGRCNFHLSENHFFPFPLLMGLSRKLPKKFLRKFNNGLSRLLASDISGKWLKPVFEVSQLCTSYSEKTLKPLQLKNIFGVLLIWGVGTTLSICCLIAEILHFKQSSQSIDAD